MPDDKFVLASHKVMVDLGRMLDGADDLRLSARRVVALVSKKSLESLAIAGDSQVEISGPRGTLTVPIEAAEVADGTVWLPECSTGEGINQDLAPAGGYVTITPAREVAQ